MLNIQRNVAMAYIIDSVWVMHDEIKVILIDNSTSEKKEPIMVDITVNDILKIARK